MSENVLVSAQAVDLPRQENLAKLVYEHLRNEIMGGAYRSGERISIRRQAERFGISPTPVREAMLQLASENALVLRVRSFSVPELTETEFVEIRKIRISLEALVTREAVRGPSPELATRLGAIHEALIAAKGRQDFPTVMIENRRFHFEIYNEAGMPQACAMIKTLWTRTGPYQSSLYDDHSHPPAAEHDHLRVIEAVHRGDPEAAAAAIIDDIALRGVPIKRALSRQTV